MALSIPRDATRLSTATRSCVVLVLFVCARCFGKFSRHSLW